MTTGQRDFLYAGLGAVAILIVGPVLLAIGISLAFTIINWFCF